MNRKEYQEHCKHYSKSFISSMASNMYVNIRCDGKCPV
nr:MAG TPA: hypothetical protein [Caudoviricetes sp.]